MFGFDLQPSTWAPLRDGIADLEATASGNVVMRVMREDEAGGPVHQVAYVVLTPKDIERLSERLAALL